MRAVVRPLRRVWLDGISEAQVTGAILWSVQEVIDLFQIGRIALDPVLDDSPSPGVGARVTHRTRNPFQLGELMHLVAER